MTGILRYWHTIRYLKPVQIVGRIAFRLRRPVPDMRAAPARRVASNVWLESPSRARGHFDGDFFEFLGVKHELRVVGWDSPSLSKLWRYNLHYFDDLQASDSSRRLVDQARLVELWIRENPPGSGTGWEPYPTSLRIVNWCKWILRHGRSTASCVHSLAVQVRWLEHRIERHLLGNHLWVNGKALVFAGVFFAGDEADRWLRSGLKILRHELDEQVLPDGAHFERSPMYHALFVEDLLDLYNLSLSFADRIPEGDVQRWGTTARAMLSWLQAVSHGDTFSHFNDVAQGVAPVPSVLCEYAVRLQLGPPGPLPSAETMLAGAGLVRLDAGPASLVADVAPVGPDYIPGHAHADTLSFELSIGGHRVFVNGGTSTYDSGPERWRQRGTAAHNTVIVDGVDSSEVWSSFRVARRARVIESSLFSDDSGVVLVGVHDGYRRLPGRVIHRRTWRIEPDCLEVSDEVLGRFKSAEARLLVAPGWRADVCGSEVRLYGPAGTVICSAEGVVPRLESANYYAGFSTVVPATRIRLDLPNGRVSLRIEWQS